VTIYKREDKRESKDTCTRGNAYRKTEKTGGNTVDDDPSMGLDTLKEKENPQSGQPLFDSNFGRSEDYFVGYLLILYKLQRLFTIK
jgi:hypothetical protein